MSQLIDHLVVTATFLFVGVTVWAGTTLLHELGHALGALAAGADGATVRVGGTRWRGRVGPLRFEFGIGLYGRAFADGLDEPSPSAETIYYLAGPVTSLAISLVASIVCAWQPEPQSLEFLARGFQIGGFTQFAATVVPWVYPDWMGHYGGRPSDGLRIWRRWRPTDED